MIYLVRHGRTTYNNEGRFQGGLDSPLTALGLEQASANGRLLKRLIGSPEGWRIQASPLGRTIHTARLLCAELGPGVGFETDARLAEVRLGEWEALTDEEIESASPGARAGTTRYDFFFRAPGGETYEAFAARLGDWLAEAQADAKPRIAISHGVAGRVLRGLYLGLEPAEALRQEAPQDAVFRLADGRVEKIAAG
ncbi:histidine phosphatase family protein [Phenylobacterium montanum]|uniref:Histidine phosphatase family protein n=1 Tax=Phenylobacterium montanum TaxID=2823693 RepID=A0A975FXJ8_9CAUL|nr:histidine phosphatase family protein [Caulobacter sp. S6]QUD87130.1 histidine phosphatase family protein [Caulobacter sp. S6]